MVSKVRTERIADRIRQELAEILIRDISDPRLVGISITDVTVDRELAYAEVYFSTLDGESKVADILAGFQHAQGFLRRELSHRIDLRVFPRLRFHWDPTSERAERIERLIQEMHDSPDNLGRSEEQ